jgi:flagellar secretion chaperone FliS
MAVRGASPVQLVIRLYEQAIEDVRRAIVAMEKGEIEGRTRAINHALKVIGHLQGTLDMEHGGEVAINLSRFYNALRTALLEAQFKQSSRILEQQVSQLVLVHEAWQEVERATSPVPSSPQPTPLDTTAPASSTEWNA